MSIGFNTAPTPHCILPAEYTILKPSFVTLLSVTKDTKAVFPVVRQSLGREIPVNVCRSGAVALFPAYTRTVSRPASRSKLTKCSCMTCKITLITTCQDQFRTFSLRMLCSKILQTFSWTEKQ